MPGLTCYAKNFSILYAMKHDNFKYRVTRSDLGDAKKTEGRETG